MYSIIAQLTCFCFENVPIFTHRQQMTFGYFFTHRHLLVVMVQIIIKYTLTAHVFTLAKACG